MMRRGVWLLLVPLAGCGWGASGTGPDAVCERQAYDDPAVKNLMVPTRAQTSSDHQYALTLALRNAKQACLRQRGIVVRGGVEPVKPR